MFTLGGISKSIGTGRSGAAPGVLSEGSEEGVGGGCGDGDAKVREVDPVPVLGRAHPDDDISHFHTPGRIFPDEEIDSALANTWRSHPIIIPPPLLGRTNL